MNFDVRTPLVSYNGQPFTRTTVNGEQVPMLLGEVLETACVNADPEKYNTGTLKWTIFQILMKVNKANPVVELSAEDLTLLKELIGRQLTVAAVGAVFTLLEKPLP